MRAPFVALLISSTAGCGGSTSSSSGGHGGTGAGRDAAPEVSSTGGFSSGGTSTGGSSADGGVTPECTSNADCKVFKDCCTCEGVPNGDTRSACHSVCDQDRCAALGLLNPMASCVTGHCVLGFSCIPSAVLCKSAPPSCPAGQIALVEGSCWQGGCVPADECTTVSNCNACTGELACATVSTFGVTNHCYAVPAACHGDFGCSCAGKAACGLGFVCADLSGPKGVSCVCPGC